MIYPVLLAVALSMAPSPVSADTGHRSMEQGETIHSPDHPSTPDSHGHEQHGHEHPENGHHHGTLDVSSAALVPALDLVVYEDAVSGWNLQLVTENFDFAPERINVDSRINEGHAHLYINGEKIMRIYSHWHHLPNLSPGRHEITVTLNANGHEELLYHGEPVADTVIISVP